MKLGRFFVATIKDDVIHKDGSSNSSHDHTYAFAKKKLQNAKKKFLSCLQEEISYEIYFVAGFHVIYGSNLPNLKLFDFLANLPKNRENSKVQLFSRLFVCSDCLYFSAALAQCTQKDYGLDRFRCQRHIGFAEHVKERLSYQNQKEKSLCKTHYYAV